MRLRLIRDDGPKPWAVILEGPLGEQISKRDYKTREAAEKARDQLAADMRGETHG